MTEGRRNDFSGFRAFGSGHESQLVPDPQSERSFLDSKLKLNERRQHATTYALYRELLKLRLQDPVLLSGDRACTYAWPVGMNVLFMHRWAGDEHRLLIANFGGAVDIPVTGRKALAELQDKPWKLLLSTAEKRFGGDGVDAYLESVNNTESLVVPARSAALFAIGAHER